MKRSSAESERDTYRALVQQYLKWGGIMEPGPLRSLMLQQAPQTYEVLQTFSDERGMLPVFEQLSEARRLLVALVDDDPTAGVYDAPWDMEIRCKYCPEIGERWPTREHPFPHADTCPIEQTRAWLAGEGAHGMSERTERRLEGSCDCGGRHPGYGGLHDDQPYARGSWWDGEDIICRNCGARIVNPSGAIPTTGYEDEEAMGTLRWLLIRLRILKPIIVGEVLAHPDWLLGSRGEHMAPLDIYMPRSFIKGRDQ